MLLPAPAMPASAGASASARAQLCERIDRIIGSEQCRGLTVAIVDIRGFRAINDVFGHDAGDLALGQVALRLKVAISGRGHFARLHDDVFALVYPNLWREDDARELACLLIDLLAAPCDIGGQGINLSSCIGLASTGDTLRDGAALFSAAMVALETAKRRGFGEYCIHTTRIMEAHERRAAITAKLKKAIANDRIDIHLQPIICMRRQRLGGFEALARWHDSELGWVSPMEFIEIAEERGYISELFRGVLQKSLRAVRRLPAPMFVAVNLSPSQMIDTHTSKTILDALKRERVHPSRLEIEVTESSVIANNLSAERIITDLKAAGVKLSLDDFGTGQSSLNRLRKLPFDKLKIDRSFVQQSEQDPVSDAIVQAIVQMCRALDIRVIVEGIETAEQAARMYRLGCDGVQGYLFARPMPVDDACRWATANS